MSYNVDNLVDQAYQDREPIEDRGDNPELDRIRKIELELEMHRETERERIEEQLLRIVNALGRLS